MTSTMLLIYVLTENSILSAIKIRSPLEPNNGPSTLLSDWWQRCFSVFPSEPSLPSSHVS
jgi:hypothetical protein